MSRAFRREFLRWSNCHAAPGGRDAAPDQDRADDPRPPLAGGRSGRKRWLVSQLFVNGKAGRPTFARQEEPTPYAPRKLLLGGHVNMAIDELRVSDIQRHTSDFTPPSRHGELAMDEHTRALFHFNGNIQGRSAGYEGELPAALVKP